MEHIGKNQNKVIVTVTDEAMPGIDRLANELVKKGLHVEQIMPMTGVIVGSYSEDQMPDINNVRGVMSVEKEMITELPPADSTLQ